MSLAGPAAGVSARPQRSRSFLPLLVTQARLASSVDRVSVRKVGGPTRPGFSVDSPVCWESPQSPVNSDGWSP